MRVEDWFEMMEQNKLQVNIVPELPILHSPASSGRGGRTALKRALTLSEPAPNFRHVIYQ